MVEGQAAYEVYLVGIDGTEKPCKIGISNNADARVANLQTGVPWTLNLLFSIDCADRADALRKEAALHAEFAAWRLRGEWFDLTCDQIVGLEPLPGNTVQ